MGFGSLARRPYGGSFVDPANAVELDHPLNRGLVSWWATPPGVPAAGGRLLDLRGRNNGTLTNGPTWRAGPNGFGKLTYDGSTNYTDCGTPANLSFDYANPFTLSAVISSSTATGGTTYGILGKYDSASVGWFLAVNSGKVYFQIQSSAVVYRYRLGATTVADGMRRLLTATSDGSGAVAGLKIYVGGAEDAYSDTQTAGSIASILTSVSVKIGVRQIGGAGGSAFYFPGEVEATSAWNRALSAAEVAALYDQSRRGYPDLMRWQSTRTFFIPTGGTTTIPKRVLQTPVWDYARWPEG